jgi:hypothetical protein
MYAKRIPFGIILSGLVALLLQGCANVLVDKPIGLEPSTITASEWDGSWFNPGGTLTVKVVDGDRGLIDIASIETKDDGLKMESHRLVLKEAGKWTLASMKADKDEGSGWLWGRIKKDEKQIIFWLPKVDEFKKLVTDGRLPGQIRDDNVILGKLTPAQLALITSDKAATLYHWDEPMVLMKLGR